MLALPLTRQPLVNGSIEQTNGLYTCKLRNSKLDIILAGIRLGNNAVIEGFFLSI